MNDLNALLRHYVSGAIERGEAEAIVGQPVCENEGTVSRAMDITVGRLNSPLGKAYAENLSKAALLQIADWAEAAKEALDKAGGSGRVRERQAELADAALYYDVECLLRRLANHAG